MSLLAANSIAIAFFSAPDSTDDSGAITPASASAVEPETFAGVASDASATPEAVPTTRAQARINRPAFILPPWACHRGFPSGRARGTSLACKRELEGKFAGLWPFARCGCFAPRCQTVTPRGRASRRHGRSTVHGVVFAFFCLAGRSGHRPEGDGIAA